MWQELNKSTHNHNTHSSPSHNPVCDLSVCFDCVVSIRVRVIFVYGWVLSALIRVTHYFSKDWFDDEVILSVYKNYCKRILNFLQIFMQTPPCYLQKWTFLSKPMVAGRQRWGHASNCGLWDVIWGGLKTHRLARGHGAEGADAVAVCDHHGRGETWRVGILWGLLLVRVHCNGKSDR